MSSLPQPDVKLSREEAAKRRLLNRIAVGAVLLVGLLGSAVMFDTVYTPSQFGKSRLVQALTADSTTSTAKPDQIISVDGEGRHVLRLGVFDDVAKAEDLQAKLEKQGIASTIVVEAHVKLGPFSTQAGIDAARAKLKELGLESGPHTPPH